MGGHGVEALIEIARDPAGRVPGALVRGAYRASRQGRILLVLKDVSTEEVDRILDAVVPRMPRVAGVAYCTPETLSARLSESGLPRLAGVESNPLASLLGAAGVCVVSPTAALDALSTAAERPVPLPR